ncbi:hypothetical protein A8H31_01160 [Burkholderia thailandensis]|nr:hypothetical protein A8H31_01160 [Burkholderia thailandensis]NOK43936.1 hypothetical protein [Burkholderia thailandensis]NOK54856.1 hypothetical protein [Burkholderia thailandensis]PHH33867.1 hypothetical protein CRX59_24650 [Burkholderia thailandensis]PNE72010.1 hypothetical protein A8H38_07870 [Burkholderia thailandensis]
MRHGARSRRSTRGSSALTRRPARRASCEPRIAPCGPRSRRFAARRPSARRLFLPPPRRLLIASRFITNRELLLCVLRARFV